MHPVFNAHDKSRAAILFTLIKQNSGWTHRLYSYFRAVIGMNLREELEQRTGKLEDRVYRHIFDMALDDQKQFKKLSKDELNSILNPVNYPPNDKEQERLAQLRERILEAMEILTDIISRRKIDIRP